MKKAIAVLPPETEQVWKLLENEPLLQGAVLVGGTALALRIGHRLSEDLDFLFTAEKLPRQALAECVRKLEQRRLRVQHNDNPASADEFAIAGMDLRDYQQDYIVDNKTKVTFFSADTSMAKILAKPPSPGRPRVAELEELFGLKALLTAQRSKTRDWFDLFVLFHHHGFTMGDYVNAFAKAGMGGVLDIALNRLCSGQPDASDEGFASLVERPPALTEMSAFFSKRRDAYEQEVTLDAFRPAKP